MEELRQELERLMEGIDRFLDTHQELENTPEAHAFDAHIVSVFPLTRGGLEEHHVAEAQKLANLVLSLVFPFGQ